MAVEQEVITLLERLEAMEVRFSLTLQKHPEKGHANWGVKVYPDGERFQEAFICGWSEDPTVVLKRAIDQAEAVRYVAK